MVMRSINEYLLTKSKNSLVEEFPSSPKMSDIIKFLENCEYEEIEQPTEWTFWRDIVAALVENNIKEKKRYMVIKQDYSTFVSFCRERSKDGIIFTLEVTEDGSDPFCEYIGWEMDYAGNIGHRMINFKEFTQDVKNHFGWV